MVKCEWERGGVYDEVGKEKRSEAKRSGLGVTCDGVIFTRLLVRDEKAKMSTVTRKKLAANKRYALVVSALRHGKGIDRVSFL